MLLLDELFDFVGECSQIATFAGRYGTPRVYTNFTSVLCLQRLQICVFRKKEPVNCILRNISDDHFADVTEVAEEIEEKLATACLKCLFIELSKGGNESVLQLGFARGQAAIGKTIVEEMGSRAQLDTAVERNQI